MTDILLGRILGIAIIIILFGLPILVLILYGVRKTLRKKKMYALFPQDDQPIVYVDKVYLFAISPLRIITTNKKLCEKIEYSFKELAKTENADELLNRIKSISGWGGSVQLILIFTRNYAKTKYPEYASAIEKKEILIGMPMEVVTAIKGKPHEVKEQAFKDKVKTNLFFGSFHNRLGNINYTLRIDMENNVVVGWKDL